MRRLVLKGVAWILAETLARNVLLFGFTVALARLLTPAEFGVVAILSLFVGIASTLAEGGLGAALIQEKEPTQRDISTLFWAQMALAFLLAGVLASIGPFLAATFDVPILQPLALAFGVNILCAAPASIQHSLFHKQINFRPAAIAAIASQIIGGLSAVALALAGAGPWAIVSQTLVASLITTVILWACSEWRPSLTFSMTSLRKFAGFGFSGVGIALLYEVELRVGSLVIGLFSSPANTGLYQRATSLQLILARLLSGIVTRIAFPTFAALQNDPPRLVRALREAAFVNFSVTAMVMWATALLAEPLVYLLLGPRWEQSATVLRALCLSAGVYPLFAVFSKALRAVNQTYLVLVQQAVRAISMCLVVWIFAGAGFSAMAWAQTALLLALLPMGCIGVARHIRYRLIDQLRDLWPVAAGGVAMWSAGLTLEYYLQDRPLIIQIALIGGGVLSSYIATIFIAVSLFRNEAWKLARGTVMTRFPPRRDSHSL